MSDKITKLVFRCAVTATLAASFLISASAAPEHKIQKRATTIGVNKLAAHVSAVSDADLNKPWSMNDLIALDDTSATHASTLADEPFPRLEVRDGSNCIKVLAEVPGINPADIELIANGDILCIKGKRPVNNNEKVVVSELANGAFERRVRLPHLVRPEQATASLTNGLLTVSLPRWQAAEAPRKISITRSLANKSYELADIRSWTPMN